MPESGASMVSAVGGLYKIAKPRTVIRCLMESEILHHLGHEIYTVHFPTFVHLCSCWPSDAEYKSNNRASEHTNFRLGKVW